MSENIRKVIEKELNVLKNNLEKFTTAVEIFDEAKKLASEAGQQISQTTKENKKILDSSSIALTELLKEQSAHIDLFEKTITKLTELEKRIAESDMPAKLDRINTALNTLNTDTKSSFNKNAEKLDQIVTSLEENNKSLSKSIKQINDSLHDKIRSGLDSVGKNLEYEAGKTNEKLTSFHKESIEWNASQMMDLEVKFSNQIQSHKDDAVFHHKFIYGGLALIILIQLLMLYVLS